MDQTRPAEMVSQGLLNGKISKCNGNYDCFKRLVEHLPRELQVRGYRHFMMKDNLKKR